MLVRITPDRLFATSSRDVLERSCIKDNTGLEGGAEKGLYYIGRNNRVDGDTIPASLF